MIKAKATVLSSYAIWKLVTLVFFILFCVNVEGTFYEKLPIFLIFFQLIAIENLITARFDSIIE